MLPFVECLHFIISTFYEGAKNSFMVRDEDVAFPSHFETHYILEPKQIYDQLSERISFYENIPKTGGDTVNKQNKDFVKCYKMVQGLMVINMYALDKASFAQVFPETNQTEEAKEGQQDVMMEGGDDEGQ